MNTERRVEGYRIALGALVMAAMLLSGGTAMAAVGLAQQADPTEPVGLIVKFSDELKFEKGARRNSVAATGIKEIDRISSDFDLKTFVSIIPKSEEEVEGDFPLSATYVIRGAEKTDYVALKARYEALGNVDRVEFDYPLQLLETPDDPLLGYQWHIDNTGQVHPTVALVNGQPVQQLVNGTPGADANALPTLENPPDNTVTAVVAIIDTGVDWDHPDLAANMWINDDEVAGNGIDDDHNGYIDDYRGWTFFNNRGAFQFDNTDPIDEYGHGTHVAGIVASMVNNNVGVAGVATDVRIMPLRLYLFSNSSFIEALAYAVHNGADVVNMSFRLFGNSEFVEEAIQYAHERGVVLCASMGNDGTNVVNYPAAYSQTIAIGATDHNDHITDFSTVGDHIDVCAPGRDVLSLRADGLDMSGTGGPHIVNQLYYLASGTSMSSPVVAGVAAVLRSVSPGLRPESVRQIINSSAVDLTDPYGTGANLPGFDSLSGHGRVDLTAAVPLAPAIRAHIDFPKPSELHSGLILITGIADGASFSSYTLEYGVGTSPSAWSHILTSTTPVSQNQLLGTWNTVGLTGAFTIRLRVGAVNFDYVTVNLSSQPGASIDAPASQDTVKGAATVYGSSYGPWFERYECEYRSVLSGPGDWALAFSGTAVVYGDSLGRWVTTGLEEGLYYLRLTTFNNGLTYRDSVEVHVMKPASWFVPLAGNPAITAANTDFDKDGVQEIVIGTNVGVEFYTPLGAPKTTGVPIFPPGDYTVPIAIGEIDGDGYGDIVAVNWDSLTLYGAKTSGGMIRIDVSSIDGADLNYYGAEYEYAYPILADLDGDNIDEMSFSFRRRTSPTVVSPFIVWPFEVVDGQSIEVVEKRQGIVCTDLDGDGIGEFYTHVGYSSYSSLHGWEYPSPQQQAPYITSTKREFGGALYNFECASLSAHDIDDDGDKELIVVGWYEDLPAQYVPNSYWMFAFEKNLSLVDSTWPRGLNKVAGTHVAQPVFVDLDQDCELEYLVLSSDHDKTVIDAYNLDGSSYWGSQPQFIAEAGTRGHYVTVADITGDGESEIIMVSHQSDIAAIGLTFFQKLHAWDNTGTTLSGFPVTLFESPPDTADASIRKYSAIIGDFDTDGVTDLIVPIWQKELQFFSFENTPFDECAAPATHWRMNPSFDAVGPSEADTCTCVPTFLCGDVDNNGTVGDYDDVMYLSNYLFYGGPPPPIPDAADVNASGTINMTDLTLLVNYYSGQQVTLNCLGSGGSGKAVAYPSQPVEIFAKQVGNETTIEVVSPIALKAIQVEFDADGKRTVTLPEQSPLTMFDGQMSGAQNIGLIDMSGATSISAGRSALVTINGKVEIVSAQAVTADYLEIDAVVKTNASGETLPTEYALNQNYPNPFNPTTQISFALPEATVVTLDVYNALGQRVSRVVDGSFEAGRHMVEWNAQTYSSGVYFYRLRAGDFTETRKMLLLK